MEKKTYNTHFDMCAYNDGVNCETRDRCINCGFRPAVQAERVKAIREKMDAEAIQKARALKKKRAKLGGGQ